MDHKKADRISQWGEVRSAFINDRLLEECCDKIFVEINHSNKEAELD
jgi:hypothetical protein